jgi:hypothetical protein
MAELIKYDSLFAYFKEFASNFYLGSHTFTHENLNDCSYQDAMNELLYNLNFADAAGWTGQPYYSRTSIVTPAISGLWNGDALKALVDNGYTSLVGDSSRENTINPQDSYWPFVTTLESSNYDGFRIIPRSPTVIYFNSSTSDEVTNLYNRLYPGSPLKWQQILTSEKNRVLYKLLQLEWDG